MTKLTNVDPDAMTILLAKNGKRVTKTWRQEGDRYHVEPYPNILTWDVKRKEVEDLDGLRKAVTQAARVRRGVVISGALRGDYEVPEEGVIRRYKKESDPFIACERRWVAIDIDDLKLNLEKGTPYPEIAAAARNALPAEFANVDCVYQFTSSAGIIESLTQNIRVRLWFLLNEPVDPRSWRGFFDAEWVDASLYNPVQPHYVAPPQFLGELKSPIRVEDRIGVLEGEVRRVDVTFIEFKAPKSESREVAQITEKPSRAQIQNAIDEILMSTTTGSRHHHALGIACELVALGATFDQVVNTVNEVIINQGRDPQENEAENAYDYAIEQAENGTLQSEAIPADKLFADETGLDDEVLDVVNTTYLKDATADVNAKVFMNRNFLSGGLVHWAGQEFEWNGRCYETLETEKTLAHRVVKDSHFPFNKSKGVADTVKGFVSREKLRLPCLLDAPEKDPGINIVVRNGIVNVDDVMFNEDVSLREHDMNYFTTVALPYNYDPNAKCPRWMQFLQDCFNDEKLERECQKMFGYLISGSNKQQKLFLLQGPSRAGKGVMCRVIKELIGADNAASPILSNFDDRFALEPLVGKPLILVPEANERDQSKITNKITDIIKSITGGDPLDVPRKGIPSLNNVTLPGRIVMACNRIPAFVDSSGALLNRMHILPFTQSFIGREDLDLEKNLLNEMSGILNWAIEGLRILLVEDNRFFETEQAKAMKSSIRDAMQPMDTFFRVCLKRDAESFVSGAEIFQLYNLWAQEAGMRYRLTRDKVVAEIQQLDAGLVYTRQRQKNGKNPRGFKGLNISAEGMDILKGEADDEFEN